MRIAIAAAAAAALLVTSVPAGAHRWRHHHDDVDAGDVVTGIAVAGGIALLASAVTEGGRQKQDAAVDACSAEAESRLNGRVAEISGVTKRKGYYTVRGLVDGGDGAAPQSFSCTIRSGTVYAFRSGASEA